MDIQEVLEKYKELNTKSQAGILLHNSEIHRNLPDFKNLTPS